MKSNFTLSIIDDVLGNQEVTSVNIYNEDGSTVSLYPFSSNLDLTDANLFLRRISKTEKDRLSKINDMKELFYELKEYSDGVLIVSYDTELGVFVSPNRIPDGLRIIANRFNNFEHIKNLTTSEMNFVSKSYLLDEPNDWKLLFPIGLTIKEVSFGYLLGQKKETRY